MSGLDKRSKLVAGMLRRLPILPAIAQGGGPASMNDANARDWKFKGKNRRWLRRKTFIGS